MATRTRLVWKRYSIATLLFLIFLAAGSFVGFRYGLSEGVENQVEQRLADQKSSLYVVAYRVPDLVADKNTDQTKAATLDRLITEIKTSIGRTRWENENGPRTVVAKAPDSIIISASSTDHDHVTAYLEGRLKGLEESTQQ
ncbi:hypothetical protein Q31b_50300 [Novipirellula aureliae]|uniref:Uncharacterized protein n=1 Tax=Novipirellula aureliae TaxID=2527966 RepID=A0A5C6DJ46_9BACT|nr:hypothetical protein [Novipirellula aureliae]TWU36748.1 hypothetical protein Q31b_50300 [Novipirellula aureliae]